MMFPSPQPVSTEVRWRLVLRFYHFSGTGRVRGGRERPGQHAEMDGRYLAGNHRASCPLSFGPNGF